MPVTKPIRLTHAEWLAEAERRYGRSMRAMKFKCPACGHVQSGQDFLDLGMEGETAATRIGFSCIGRWMPHTPVRSAFSEGEGPCNYAGGGFLRIAPVHVLMDDGTEVYVFDFADEPLTEPLRVAVEVDWQAKDATANSEAN